MGCDMGGLWQLASKVEQALWVAAGSSITSDYRQRYRYTALALRTHPVLRKALLQVRIQKTFSPYPLALPQSSALSGLLKHLFLSATCARPFFRSVENVLLHCY
jgi:hypothetical protein